MDPVRSLTALFAAYALYNEYRRRGSDQAIQDLESFVTTAHEANKHRRHRTRQVAARKVEAAKLSHKEAKHEKVLSIQPENVLNIG